MLNGDAHHSSVKVRIEPRISRRRIFKQTARILAEDARARSHQSRNNLAGVHSPPRVRLKGGPDAR